MKHVPVPSMCLLYLFKGRKYSFPPILLNRVFIGAQTTEMEVSYRPSVDEQR